MNTTMRGLVPDRRADYSVSMRHDLQIPSPAPGEVRVRVTHASVNRHEFELANGLLGRLMQQLPWVRGEVRTGLEFSGVVQTQGERFRSGDEVMGYVDMVAGWRPHAEYIAIPEAFMTKRPSGVSPHHAAALPMSAQTALVALRDVARVEEGQRVLVLGASGGVGVMAVQLSRILGAHPTAVASARHHERLRALGATQTVEYRETPLAEMNGTFDAVLDFSSTAYFRDIAHLLSPQGVFVPGDPLRNALDILSQRRAKWLMVDRGDGELLEELADWAERGDLVAVIDEVFGLDDWRSAVARGHERGRIGRTILSFHGDMPGA